MKVCHIVEAGGGVSKHLIKIAKYMDEKSVEQVFIVSSVREDGLIDYLKANIMNYVTIDMNRNINIIADIRSFVKIYSYLKKNKVDIVHCHSSKAGFIGRAAATFAGIPIKIYSPHAFAFNDYIPKYKKYIYIYLEKIIGMATTMIIASSETEYEDALKSKIVCEKKICLIHNGIELDSYDDGITNKKAFLKTIGLEEIGENTKIIGFISRLELQKDPKTLIKALGKLKNKNFIALICGDGSLYDEVKKEAKLLDCCNKIFFLGYRKDLFTIIKMIDIFILPSLWEGLPYILLETMFFSKAVVVSNVVGNKDVVSDNYNGMLFNPKDYNHLAVVLDSLLADDIKIKKLGDNAKEYICKNYDIKKMIKDYENLYFKLYKEE